MFFYIKNIQSKYSIGNLKIGAIVEGKNKKEEENKRLKWVC